MTFENPIKKKLIKTKMTELTLFDYFEKTYIAISDDNIDAIREIIPEHIRPDHKFPKKYSDSCRENMPIFIFAMLINSVKTVKYLLECRININNISDSILI